MTFGLPIMLNPILAIPFIITPLVTGSIAYFLTVIGFADVLVYAIPWTTPPILSAWLASGGSITCIITQLICIAVSILIYIPLLLQQTNKQKLKRINVIKYNHPSGWFVFHVSLCYDCYEGVIS